MTKHVLTPLSVTGTLPIIKIKWKLKRFSKKFSLLGNEYKVIITLGRGKREVHYEI